MVWKPAPINRGGFQTGQKECEETETFSLGFPSLTWMKIKMEINKIEDIYHALQAEAVRLKGIYRRCIYYKEEICMAPKVRFQICKTCYRVEPRFVLRNLFEKIIRLAEPFFSFLRKPPLPVPPA